MWMYAELFGTRSPKYWSTVIDTASLSKKDIESEAVSGLEIVSRFQLLHRPPSFIGTLQLIPSSTVQDLADASKGDIHDCISSLAPQGSPINILS